MTRNVGDSLPLVGTRCGSPTGIPFAFTEPGRTVELLNPFDPAHDNGTMLVNAKGGGGKTFAVNVILARCLAHGMRGYVLDRAGHYAFLCSLIPGARHLTIGASERRARRQPLGRRRTPRGRRRRRSPTWSGCTRCWSATTSAGDDSYGLDALERNLLEVAIRAVYQRAAAASTRAARVAAARRAAPPRRTGGRGRRERGGVEAAHAGRAAGVVLRRGLLRLPARPHHHRARRRAAGRLRHPQGAQGGRAGGAVRAGRARLRGRSSGRRPSASTTADAGAFAGRSVLVIDEAWKLVERRATGEWVNDLARRARHLGLFLVAISQQLSDFAGEYGKALIRNSTMQLFLRQAPEELAYVQDALQLSEQEIRAIARLKTVKRSFSQAYWINGTRGRGTIALRVGPSEYWLATSDPVGDAPLRAQALEDAGGDAWRALERARRPRAGGGR